MKNAAFSALLFIMCIMLSVRIYAQISSLDSALSSLSDPRHKVDLILDYLSKPENQYLEDLGNRSLLNRALLMAENTSYQKGRVNCLVHLGFSYFRSSDYKRAMELGMQAKELAEDLDLKSQLAGAYSLLGTIYNELGVYNYSSQYFFNSLRIYEKIDDKEGIAQSLGDIGMDFFNQKDHSKALQYFNQALTIANKTKSLVIIKRQINNIAVVYGDMEKYDSAIYFLNKALQINIKLGDKLAQGTNIMNIGYDLMNLGELRDAELRFQEAIVLFKQMDNRLHMAECYLNLGFCYQLMNDVNKSITYFQAGLQEGRENGYQRIIYTAADALNRTYAENKDTIKAYQFAILEKQALDSLNLAQRHKLLTKLELQYTYEKQELKRQMNQKIRNNLMLGVIICLLSATIILFLLFSRSRLKSRFISLEREKMRSELDIKDRELTVNLITLIRKNEMLSEISNKLIQFEKLARNQESKDIIADISHELRSNTDDKMLNEFSARFREVHAGFYEKLLVLYPDLTQNELKLCAFLRLNMSTKDISELTGQLLTSIDQARYRLRKKLGISNSEMNLVTFLSQL